MIEEWKETDAHAWTVYMEKGHRAFRFIWWSKRMLAIEIGWHMFGPFCYEAACDILENLKDLLADDGAAMASYVEYSDGSTEIHRGNGVARPANIKLHAYMEIEDRNGELVKLTLDQMEDFYGALCKVLSDIEDGDEPWCLCKEVSE